MPGCRPDHPYSLGHDKLSNSSTWRAKTASPSRAETGRLDVESRLRRDPGGARLAGVLQDLAVGDGEGASFLFVSSVERGAEELAEGVREIIKGQLGRIVVPFYEPHVRMKAFAVQGLSVCPPLRVEHQLAVIPGRELGLGAALEHGALEIEAGEDVDDDLASVLEMELEDRGPLRGPPGGLRPAPPAPSARRP